MNKMFIINKILDYADEFDYTIRSYITEKERQIILEFSEDLELLYEAYNKFDNEYYFGTNECFEFDFDEIIDIISDAQEISQEEIKILNKYNCAYLDVFKGFKHRIETFINRAIENGDNINQDLIEIIKSTK